MMNKLAVTSDAIGKIILKALSRARRLSDSIRQALRAPVEGKAGRNR